MKKVRGEKKSFPRAASARGSENGMNRGILVDKIRGGKRRCRGDVRVSSTLYLAGYCLVTGLLGERKMYFVRRGCKGERV